MYGVMHYNLLLPSLQTDLYLSVFQSVAFAQWYSLHALAVMYLHYVYAHLSATKHQWCSTRGSGVEGVAPIATVYRMTDM